MASKSRLIAQTTPQPLAAVRPYVDTVPLDADAALHYAGIRADLKRRGLTIGANDLLIAAHARQLALT